VLEVAFHRTLRIPDDSRRYNVPPTPRDGSTILAAIKSVFVKGEERGEQPLPENEGFEQPEPVVLRSRRPSFRTASDI